MKKISKKNLLPVETLEMVAKRFKMLSDPTRLQILQFLMQGEQSVGSIQQHIQSSQPNISKHLHLMTANDLLLRRKLGVQVYYSILDPTVFQVCQVVCDGLENRQREQIKLLSRKLK